MQILHYVVYGVGVGVVLPSLVQGTYLLDLVLLRTSSNSPIRVRALNCLKLSRLVVLRGLGS
jgi:hypothetical protein